ncbi:MAG TPA: PP2C family serine/threonine-protein phosphatase [Pyrinomonadaceae bacterium]|nr:PP2C family serine/threonine-protein phosphatase [Pyrinomonadaceae bacterium]
MSRPQRVPAVASSAVSDRGLNERRPLNEDSFLADSERGIFAVADGVGGAEAGEVASQTAVEVLDEAFRHQVDGADIEDLMELSIQRANASIYQMAQEHARFSMMATTIVALHLKDNVATIGHVGDSRLYRLTPDGQLIRETEDHSVVEEEVRAGRMTPEQAANHPSKNVISRALGAEESVEVDLKTVEVAEGTEFLLCTDGITRHLSDDELRQLLVLNEDLDAVCAELKRRCYERGAEDNLTAVLVRVGDPIPVEQREGELEPTISPETRLAATQPLDETHANTASTPEVLVPPSRKAFPGLSSASSVEPMPAAQSPLRIDSPEQGASRSGRWVISILVFLLVLASAAVAFYAGARYGGKLPLVARGAAPLPQPANSPSPLDDSLATFERSRREVDMDPAQWLVNQMQSELVSQGIQDPLSSTNAEFLYLYGRASLLTGHNEEAAKALEQSIMKASQDSTVRKEATLALAALNLKSERDKPQALTHFDEMLQKPATGNTP